MQPCIPKSLARQVSLPLHAKPACLLMLPRLRKATLAVLQSSGWDVWARHKCNIIHTCFCLCVYIYIYKHTYHRYVPHRHMHANFGEPFHAEPWTRHWCQRAPPLPTSTWGRRSRRRSQSGLQKKTKTRLLCPDSYLGSVCRFGGGCTYLRIRISLTAFFWSGLPA